jgi:hypothetical protein
MSDCCGAMNIKLNHHEALSDARACANTYVTLSDFLYTNVSKMKKIFYIISGNLKKFDVLNLKLFQEEVVITNVGHLQTSGPDFLMLKLQLRVNYGW